MFAGGNPFGGGGGGGGGDRRRFGSSSDIFSGIFNTGGGRGTRTKPATERGKDLETSVTLSFEQALDRRAGAGVGGHPLGVHDVPRHAAPGRARRRRSARSATAAASRPRARACSRSPARARAATAPGTVIEDPCATCAGEGRLREMKRYRVNIPAGVREGSRIRLAGKGEAGPARRAGRRPVRGHPRHRVRRCSSPRATTSRSRCRSRSPRRSAAPRSRCRRCNGTKKLRVAPGTKHGTVQRLRGEGAPILSGSGRGDLHYRFVIDMPRDLTPSSARPSSSSRR